jgi:hypothetical protein
VPVRGGDGRWDFEGNGISINGHLLKGAFNGTASTGTDLWYMPNDLAGFYYSKVQGSFFDTNEKKWKVPCNSKPPDVAVTIAGRNLTVPGINMVAWETQDVGICMGGMQPKEDDRFSTFGLTFMKHMYIIHEHYKGKQPRLGFAHSQHPGIQNEQPIA